MLTIKEPLRVKCLSKAVAGWDRISARIADKYRLMACTLTPQDFIHIMTEPPQLYLAYYHQQNLEQKNHVSIRRQLNLELLNSLVNRIQLLDTNQLTYQDEVFITDMLQKLGIYETQQFISAVREQKRHSICMLKLLESYWTQGKKIHQAAKQLKQPDGTVKEKRLQNQIYQRLQTAFLNNVVYEFQKAEAEMQGKLSAESILLSEQIQLSDRIQLSELKMLVLNQEHPQLWIDYNQYERLYLAPEKISEKNIFSQLNGAMLSYFLNQLSYYSLQKEENRYGSSISSRTSYSCSNAFYRSCETVIARFMEPGNKQLPDEKNNWDYMGHLNELYERESLLVHNLEYVSGNTPEAEAMVLSAVTGLLQLQNMERQTLELQYLEAEGRAAAYREDRLRLVEHLRQQARVLESIQEVYVKQYRELVKEQQEEAAALSVKKPDQEREKVLFEEENIFQEEEGIFREEENIFRNKEAYKEYLDSINQKNIRMHEKFLNHEKRLAAEKLKQTQNQVVVDKKTALWQTLLALEHPTEALEQVLERSKPIPQKEDSEIQVLLELAEEPVRKLYERLLDSAKEQTAVPDQEEPVPEAYGRIKTEIKTETKIENLRVVEEVLGHLNQLLHRIEEETELQMEQIQHCKGRLLQKKERQMSRKMKLVQRMQQETQTAREEKAFLVKGEKETALAREYFMLLESRQEQQLKYLDQRVRQLPAKESRMLEITWEKQIKRQGQQQEAAEAEVWLQAAEKQKELILHKETANISEEALEQLIQWRRETREPSQMEKVNTKASEAGQTKVTIEKKLMETRQELHEESRQDISRIVNQNLKSQMSSIADEMYRSLEHKLQSERRRRGY